MNNKVKLLEILFRYGLSFNSERRRQLEERARPEEVEETLEYLMKDLKIGARSIEKCVSILFVDPNAIKANYNFLKEKKIQLYNVETCLHILETDEKSLKETYEFVESTFGSDVINKNTTILRIPKERIKTIEYLFGEVLDKDTLLGAATSRRTIQEIDEIISICVANRIKITSTVFKQPPYEIIKIVDLCKENKIKITGSVFHRTSGEIKKILEICQRENIELSNSIFGCPVEDLEELITAARENDIDIQGVLFRQNKEQLVNLIY